MTLKRILNMYKRTEEVGSVKKGINNRKTIKVILWTIFWTLILSQMFTAIFGWTIVDPLLQQITPPDVVIDPYPHPQVHDGKQWIRVNIINEGLSDIDPISVEYQLCNMDTSKKGILHSTILKKEEEDYFEVESNLNTNCSIITDPVKVKVYKDSEGICYVQTTESISNVCKYCEMNIKVFEGNKKIEELCYPYPFFEGEVYGGIQLDSEKRCKSYEEAENTSELVLETEMEAFLLDPSHGCLRGDPGFTREWCEKHGYPTTRSK